MSKAGDYEMPFGKYKGEDLDSIAETDEGLKYLDWIVGERPDLRHVREFLEQPDVARRLSDLLGDD